MELPVRKMKLADKVGAHPQAVSLSTNEQIISPAKIGPAGANDQTRHRHSLLLGRHCFRTTGGNGIVSL